MLRQLHSSVFTKLGSSPSTTRARLLPAAVALAAGILFLGAACGDDSTSAPTANAATSAATKVATTAPAATAPATAPSTAGTLPPAPTPTTAAPASTDIQTRDNVSTIGTVLTNSAGLTLYTFNADQATPGKSQCNVGCSSTWPAASPSGATPTKPAAVAGDLTVITRDDGTKQLAYKGPPALPLRAGQGAWRRGRERHRQRLVRGEALTKVPLRRGWYPNC